MKEETRPLPLRLPLTLFRRLTLEAGRRSAKWAPTIIQVLDENLPPLPKDDDKPTHK
jgi:hypothetical protein